MFEKVRAWLDSRLGRTPQKVEWPVLIDGYLLAGEFFGAGIYGRPIDTDGTLREFYAIDPGMIAYAGKRVTRDNIRHMSVWAIQWDRQRQHYYFIKNRYSLPKWVVDTAHGPKTLYEESVARCFVAVEHQGGSGYGAGTILNAKEWRK